VGDLDAVIKGNWLCNDLGMDPISMGSTLAAAMELYERGVINDQDVEMPLRFGSAEAVVRMVEATAYREGFGDALAEGSKRLGERLAHPEVHMGSKGQEYPAYDPRAFPGMGVAYATCNRGGCHLRAWTPGWETSRETEQHTTDGKGEWVAHEQDSTTAQDNTGLCLFVESAGATMEMLVACTATATGEAYTVDDFIKSGERTWNLERLWNLRAGLTAAEDAVPERLTKEAFRSGPSAGVTLRLAPMLSAYYRERGWSADGIPSEQKLLQLGLASL
jgi:aldehyde:ferredoxin oxidoreductase